MPGPTNDPRPFLLEIHGLKPLTFGDEAQATGIMTEVDALKTQPDEIGPLPPIRRVDEPDAIDVWEHAAVDQNQEFGDPRHLISGEEMIEDDIDDVI